MRKSLVALIIVFGLLTQASISSAAAPKAGANCTKLNQKVNSANKVFTCVKSGKKLVWNKGVLIVKPTPTATATPTPTPTATSSGSGGSGSGGSGSGGSGSGGSGSGGSGSGGSGSGGSGSGGSGIWRDSIISSLGLAPDLKCAGSATQLTSGLMKDVNTIGHITPMGEMTSTHVTPVDHIYIYFPQQAKPAGTYMVTSPADGFIVGAGDFRIGNGYPYPDYRLIIMHSCKLFSVYIHVGTLIGSASKIAAEMQSTGSWSGSIEIKAGEVIADDSANPNFDYSLFDGSTKLSGFANLDSYANSESWKPFTVDPFEYMSSAVKSSYAAKVTRTATPVGGKIDYDKVGGIIGNWFVKGTNGYAGQGANANYANATGSSKVSRGYWDTHLAIAPHNVDTAQYIFSVGDWDGCPCQMVAAPGQINPSSITAASGTIVYELREFQLQSSSGSSFDQGGIWPQNFKVVATNIVAGYLAIRVNADNSITVEKGVGLAKSSFTAFTSKALTYTH